MSDTFCIMPWNSMAVTPDGRVTPCCAIKNTSKFFSPDISDSVRDSDLWREIRQSMLDGKKVSECEVCYKKESIGAVSQRLLHTKDSIKPINIDPLPLQRIEVAFSNLCNLACVGCDEETSSTFAAKNGKKPAYVSHGQTFDGVDLSKLTYLKILGGEPLMEELKLIDLLNKLDLNNIKIEFITNGTRFPSKQLLSLLNRCKSIKIHVSMDGVPEINEWVRWPVKHSLVVENMKKYENIKNVNLRISSLINVYNVWSLERFYDYVSSEFSYWIPLFNWINYPRWQSIDIIPENHRPIFNSYDEVFKITRERMATPSKSNVKEFIRANDFLMKQRGINVLNLIPELKNMIKMEI